MERILQQFADEAGASRQLSPLPDTADNVPSWSAERAPPSQGRQRSALPVFVINLARSTERWACISRTAQAAGVDLRRVEAVDGSRIDPSDRDDLNLRYFRIFHGRHVMDGEYGCYRSHIEALRRIVQQGHRLAVVAEDDIELPADFERRVRAAFVAEPQTDLLKLMNHRVSGFIRRGTTALGDEFGRCIHGPQGSAACYAVTARGARQLLDSLSTMWLPYDVALERGWSTGVSTYTLRRPAVGFQASMAETTIATREQYRATKLPKFRQIGTAAFRGWDYLCRTWYALRGSQAARRAARPGGSAKKTGLASLFRLG